MFRATRPPRGPGPAPGLIQMWSASQETGHVSLLLNESQLESTTRCWLLKRENGAGQSLTACAVPTASAPNTTAKATAHTRNQASASRPPRTPHDPLASPTQRTGYGAHHENVPMDGARALSSV